jgi:hypothetical protein
MAKIQRKIKKRKIVENNSSRFFGFKENLFAE